MNTTNLKVSIFTPTHNPKFILDTYNSIKRQTYNQWVIFLNNNINVSDLPACIIHDSRTKIITGGVGIQNIGALKKIACSFCDGDILVELDHDDILLPNALAMVHEAFLDESVVFAYSDCAEFNDSDWSSRQYDSNYGWEHYTIEYEGHTLTPAITPDPIPYHASIIYHSPNHFRAFRKSAYDRVGGYDASLSICDDQDLMCRLYMEGKFYHIKECLYLYRVHGNNTWLERNAAIQEETLRLQKKWIRPMVESWANSNNLVKLDLGGRFNSPDGYVSVDFKGGDVRCDLNKQWPFEDSSVGVIRAFDIIEHLKDPIHTMSEIHRVLIPGGYVFIEVPSTDGRGAWQDPMHISWWNENSFWYYTDRNLAQYIDNDTIKFKSIVLETHFPSDWHRQHNISYVRSDMVCVKDGVKLMGANLI